jgi:hypothetical protein
MSTRGLRIPDSILLRVMKCVEYEANRGSATGGHLAASGSDSERS